MINALSYGLMNADCNLKGWGADPFIIQLR
jgi:hypothetical protein